ncbi:MAG: glycosyltransferase family 39 protein [Nitriliruptorales bacterium]|nr:glycosyltransferase family 39 protein [Nitriliruptorales bacterium]
MPSAASRWWLLLFVGLALGLDLLLVLVRRFDGLYGQDAFAYLGRAEEIGRFPGVELPPFVFGDGYPAVVAALDLVAPSTVVAAQIVSIAAGVGVVLLTFAIARDSAALLGASRADRAGLLGAAISLVSAQRWQWSVAVMSDTTALALGAMALWSALRFGRTRQPSWLVVAGLMLGGAAVTRFEYAMLALPLLAGTLLFERSSWHGVRNVSAAVLAIALPVVLVLTVEVGALSHHEWVREWSPANAARSSFATPSGAVDLHVPLAVALARSIASPTLLGPVMALLALFGSWTVLAGGRSGRREAWTVLVMLVGWPVVIAIVYLGIPFHNPRWSLTFLVPLAALAGIGVSWLWSTLARVWYRVGTGTVVAISIVGGFAWGVPDVLGFVDRKQADLAATRWIEETVPADTRVLAFGLTATLDHYTDLTVDEFYLLSDAELAELLGAPVPIYLVADLEDIGRRWEGLPPQQHLATLERGPGVETIGQLERWTLLRIGGPADR